MTDWRHLLYGKCEIQRMAAHFSPSCLGLWGNLCSSLNLIFTNTKKIWMLYCKNKISVAKQISLWPKARWAEMGSHFLKICLPIMQSIWNCHMFEWYYKKMLWEGKEFWGSIRGLVPDPWWTPRTPYPLKAFSYSTTQTNDRFKLITYYVTTFLYKRFIGERKKW